MTWKTLAVCIATTSLLTVFGIAPAGARNASVQGFDASNTYKGKCVACHGPKAEKKYDPAKPEDEQVQAVLKGKKAEKPPNMPGYESKGVTAEQAKALVDYMKSLRQ